MPKITHFTDNVNSLSASGAGAAAAFSAVSASSAGEAAKHQPPYTNRGVEVLRYLRNCVFAVDWLALTIWNNGYAFKMFCENVNLTDGSLETSARGARGFRFLRYHPVTQGKVYTVAVHRDGEFMDYGHVEMPASHLRSLDFRDILFELDALTIQGIRWQVTRLDLALDHQEFTPHKVAQYIEKSIKNPDKFQMKTRVERKNINEIRSLGSVAGTVYVGAPSSDKRLRIYTKTDKNSPFEGESFTRVELQLRSDYAKYAFNELLQYDFNEWAVRALAFVRGFFDLPAVRWWKRFCEGVQSAKILLRGVTKSLQKTEEWLRQQVAPSLALWLQARAKAAEDRGSQIIADLRSLIDDGMLRWSREQVDIYHEYHPDQHKWDVPVYLDGQPSGADRVDMVLEADKLRRSLGAGQI